MHLVNEKCHNLCRWAEAEIAELKKLHTSETIFIGADRGALHLLQMGIIPHEAVGDFDSVSENEYKTIIEAVRIVDRFRAEKNETDTELAVERAMTYHPEKIILTGVTGGRLDHAESALHLLYRFQTEFPHIQFAIRNPLNELTMLNPGIHELTQEKQLPYVSFFPFGGSGEGTFACRI